MREEVNSWALFRGAGTETLNEGTRPGRTEKHSERPFARRPRGALGASRPRAGGRSAAP